MHIIARFTILAVILATVVGCSGSPLAPSGEDLLGRAQQAWNGDWHAVWQVEWDGAPIRGPLTAEVWHAADGRLRIERRGRSLRRHPRIHDRGARVSAAGNAVTGIHARSLPAHLMPIRSQPDWESLAPCASDNLDRPRGRKQQLGGVRCCQALDTYHRC